MTLRGEILDEAKNLTEGDRNDAYGDPYDEYKRLAKMWSAFLEVEISPMEAVQMMVMLKMNRSKQAFKKDTFVDQAAYSAIAGEVAQWLT